MSDKFSQLTTVCPGSSQHVGVQYAGQTVACQTCNKPVLVSRLGIMQHHHKGFRYLNYGGQEGEMAALGLTYRDSRCYYEFAVGSWGAERTTVFMDFSLYELKRLHEFLGSAISDIEQACASSPAFYAQVKRAGD